MSLLDSLRIALGALSVHKLRTLLTTLGIIIGVAAVIALMSIGTGAQRSITARIESLGTNLLFIRPGAVTEAGVRGALGSRPTLTLEDAQAIANQIPLVAGVAPETATFAQVVAKGQNTRTRIVGVTPEYQYVRNFQVAEGDFISQRHLETRAKVAVLGSGVAETLFEGISPVGERIRIGNYRLRVVGVLQTKGGTGLGYEDDVVLVPLTSFQAAVARLRTPRGLKGVQLISVQVADREYMEEAKEEIAALLRERHQVLEDDFTIVSQEEIIRTFSQVMMMLTLFLGSVAGISLLVGGIGIMNIMLVSVAERTREIGIRKAVGAKRRHILVQFLIEAIILSLSGGIIGILLGIGSSQLISGINIGGQVLRTAISPYIILLAFSVATATGLFFGLYPASRAAQLHPAEALRYE